MQCCIRQNIEKNIYLPSRYNVSNGRLQVKVIVCNGEINTQNLKIIIGDEEEEQRNIIFDSTPIYLDSPGWLCDEYECERNDTLEKSLCYPPIEIIFLFKVLDKNVEFALDFISIAKIKHKKTLIKSDLHVLNFMIPILDAHQNETSIEGDQFGQNSTSRSFNVPCNGVDNCIFEFALHPLIGSLGTFAFSTNLCTTTGAVSSGSDYLPSYRIFIDNYQSNSLVDCGRRNAPTPTITVSSLNPNLEYPVMCNNTLACCLSSSTMGCDLYTEGNCMYVDFEITYTDIYQLSGCKLKPIFCTTAYTAYNSDVDKPKKICVNYEIDLLS